MNCGAHCRGCGVCFSSTTAFDRHRSGPWSDRKCLDPRRHKKLHAHRGECAVAGNEVSKTTVWATLPTDLEESG